MVSLLLPLLWSPMLIPACGQPRKTAIAFKISAAAAGQYKVNIKSNTFHKLLHDNDAFIDRTMLVEKIVECDKKIVLITQPHNWGKSVNLDMLKTFFELQVYHHGDVVEPKNTTDNYRLFKYGHITLAGLNLGQLSSPMLISHMKLFETHQGNHPVIHMDFQPLKGVGHVDVMRSFNHYMSKVYRNHSHLAFHLRAMLADPSTPPDQRPTVERDLNIFHRMVYGQEDDIPAITNSVRTLSELLHRYYHRQVYIMIDNFDAAVMNMLHDKEFLRTNEDSVIGFYADVLTSAFYSNDALRTAILTASLDVCVDRLLPSADMLRYDFFDNPWSEFYGVSEPDVYDFLHLAANVSDDDFRDEFRIRYGGYVTSSNPRPVYNPWSVISYFYEKHILNNYWNSLSDARFLLNALRIRPARLLVERAVTAHDTTMRLSRLRFTKEHIVELRDAVDLIERSQTPIITDILIDGIVGRLCAAGYFAYVGHRYNATTQTNVTVIRTPNWEADDELVMRLKWVYQICQNIAPMAVQSIMHYFQLFINNDDNLARGFQYEFTTICRSYRFFKIQPTKQDPNKIAEINHVFVHSLITYFGLEFLHTYGFRGNISFNESEPNFTLYKGDRGVIVKFRFNFPSGKAVWQLYKPFKEVFNTMPQIRTIKVIGIGISAKRHVNIYAKVHRVNESLYTTQKYDRYRHYDEDPEQG